MNWHSLEWWYCYNIACLFVLLAFVRYMNDTQSSQCNGEWLHNVAEHRT